MSAEPPPPPLLLPSRATTRIGHGDDPLSPRLPLRGTAHAQSSSRSGPDASVGWGRPLASFLAALLICAPTPPARSAAPPDKPLIPVAFDSVEQAARVWHPMHETTPAEPVTVDGVRALRLRCNLEGTDMPRASWDADVRADLRLTHGVRFRFRCTDASPVASFSLYFRSGGGWYSTRFAPRADGQWETVEVLKSGTGVEGKPAGWGKIDGIRLSAWRGGDRDTSLLVSDFRVAPAEPDIAIARGVSGLDALPEGERKGVTTFAENVARGLSALGVSVAVVDDVDLDKSLLSRLKLVILPYSPNMPETIATRLAAFVTGGGHVIGFYSCHPELLSALGMAKGAYVSADDVEGRFGSIVPVQSAMPGAPQAVRQASWNINVVEPVPGRSRVVARWYSGDGRDTGHPAIVASRRGMWMTHVYMDADRLNGGRMLLAMVGTYVPDAWSRAATAAVRRVGRLGPWESFQEAEAAISGRAADQPRAGEALRKARGMLAEAGRLGKAAKHQEAIAAAHGAQEALERAFYLVQRPAAPEFRGAWCHRGYGIDGWSWDESIKRFAAGGLNAIFPNMLWGGKAFYPSRYLPHAVSASHSGDQLAACLSACRKYGVQLHVWKVNFNMGYGLDKAFVASMRKQGRIQRSFGGDAGKAWLCPSHPANQRLEIDSMVEVAERYPVDGIHFDYIRYPGSDHCFCDGCRQRFEAALGTRVTSWPGGVRDNDSLRGKWLDFRRNNITAVVRGVHERARKARPGIKISAAVFRNWHRDRDGVGQDWVQWCKAGYLDFVCPMDYIPADAAFQRTVEQQLALVEGTNVPLYPGIGLSTARFGAQGVVSQVNITRKCGTGGFILFEYNRQEALDVLPNLALGLTRR